MTDGMGWDAPWADDDDQTDAGPEPVFDAFEAFLPAQQSDAVGGIDDVPGAGESDNDEVQTLLFTATNPGETVSVTALMDGRVFRVELAPQVTRMAEADLANEITTVATLARMQALAGQHVIIGGLMRQLGHDDVSMRSFLEHELHLPSLDAVYSEQARLFGAYYRDDDERSTD